MYVSPEILELGRVEALTLGAGGPLEDRCECALTIIDPEWEHES